MTKNSNKHRQIATLFTFGFLLFACSFLLLYLANTHKTFADWYVQTVYPVWVKTLGRFSSLFSFSLSEFLLYFFLLLLFILLLRFFYRILKKQTKFRFLLLGISWVFFSSSILMLLYTLNCGINYQRTSFSKMYGYPASKYSVSELSSLCLYLTNQVNQRSLLITRDFDGTCQLGRGTEDTAIHAMESLGDFFYGMASYYPRPKPLLNSKLLSVQHLSGIYSPFTIEANYNRDMSSYNLPFTACHELAHLNGFMQEQEANFIAYLACVGSDNLEFQYSGYLTAWIYATNALHREDKAAYDILQTILDPSVIDDLQANSNFWNQYRGKISTVSAKVNDAYLKANGQKEGVKSYNKLVDMLITQRRKEGIVF